MVEYKIIEELLKRDRRFTLESYKFIDDSLDFAQKKWKKVSGASQSEKLESISGSDLCQAVCELALERFGYLAPYVLANLGIRKTGDIGDIVYNLIEIELMQAMPDDSRSDFDNVFDLTTKLQTEFAFRKNN